MNKTFVLMVIGICLGNLLLVACRKDLFVEAEPPDYTLKCSYVGEGTFQRCENPEVICYIGHVYDGDSLSCFEKKVK